MLESPIDRLTRMSTTRLKRVEMPEMTTKEEELIRTLRGAVDNDGNLYLPNSEERHIVAVLRECGVGKDHYDRLRKLILDVSAACLDDFSKTSKVGGLVHSAETLSKDIYKGGGRLESFLGKIDEGLSIDRALASFRGDDDEEELESFLLEEEEEPDGIVAKVRAFFGV